MAESYSIRGLTPEKIKLFLSQGWVLEGDRLVLPTAKTTTKDTSPAATAVASSLLDLGSLELNKALLARLESGTGVKGNPATEVAEYRDPDFLNAGGTPAERKAHAIKLANTTLEGKSEADRDAIIKARLWYTGQKKGGKQAGWKDDSLKSIRRGEKDKGRKMSRPSSNGKASTSKTGNGSSSNGSSTDKSGNVTSSGAGSGTVERDRRDRLQKVIDDAAGAVSGKQPGKAKLAAESPVFSNQQERKEKPVRGKRAGFRQTAGTTARPAKNKKAQQKLEKGVPTLPGKWGSEKFASAAIAREDQVKTEQAAAKTKALASKVLAANAPRSTPRVPKAKADLGFLTNAPKTPTRQSFTKAKTTAKKRETDVRKKKWGWGK